MAEPADDPVHLVTWMLRGQWVTLSIRAAIELGVFDALQTPTTIAELAARSECDEPSMARLVRVLVDLGLVEPAGPDAVADPVVATALGRTLADSHPSRLRDLALMQSELANLASWRHLADALRSGGSVFEAVNGIGPWESLSANPEQESTFNAAMARRGADQAAAVLGACDLHDVELVVDVGGGRGAMLAELLRARPDLRGVVADRTEVAAAAQEYLVESGLEDRAVGVATDFFVSVPTGADAYLMANVLHDWPDDAAIRILRTIRAAAGPTARLWVVEHVLDAPGRTFEELRDVHLVDLHMLVMFGARERTLSEYDVLLAAAGFQPARLLASARGWDVIETRPRPT